MPTEGNPILKFRATPELIAQIEKEAEQSQMAVAEWLRRIAEFAVGGEFREDFARGLDPLVVPVTLNQVQMDWGKAHAKRRGVSVPEFLLVCIDRVFRGIPVPEVQPEVDKKRAYLDSLEQARKKEAK